MSLYKVKHKQPTLQGDGHFIAPNASVIGDVVLKANSSIWFNTVLRAEMDSISIGENRAYSPLMRLPDVSSVSYP